MAKFFEVRKRLSRIWKGGVGMVVEAFREICGVGGFQGNCYKRKPLMSLGRRFLQCKIFLIKLKEFQGDVEDFQASKGIYRGCRSYANVVAKGGPRNGALLPVGKWPELSVEIHSEEWESVTKVAWDSLKLIELVEGEIVGGDASKCRATYIARGGRWAWSFTITVSVTREDEEDNLFRSESTRSRDELMPAGGCISQRPKMQRGYAGRNGWGGSLLGPAEGNNNGPTMPETLVKARPVKPRLGQKTVGSYWSNWGRRFCNEKGESFEVQTRGFAQKEEKVVSKKLWTTFFLQVLIVVKDFEVTVSLFFEKSSSVSEECLMEEDFGAGSQMERGLRASPLFHCQSTRNQKWCSGKGPRRQEAKRLCAIPISKKTKKVFWVEWGRISMVHHHGFTF
ncbi:hypothetical protein CK203_050256 [Vitis vinifera]|uniref:DUF4283 domain-containing protein n=1 Tax=Vitis vinifera TaxID=29760 RepID=A0A438GZF2_VITVI|nr:hypothetical protein CK203_050256 [Vitis vinifera]